jgi:hypothetical protein
LDDSRPSYSVSICERASPAAALTPVPAADSTCPVESVTVTWSGSMSWTLEETRLVTAWICSPDSVVPGARSRRTDAVGFPWSVTKTSSFGRATCTTAEFTPLRASSVWDSSPSSARW